MLDFIVPSKLLETRFVRTAVVSMEAIAALLRTSQEESLRVIGTSDETQYEGPKTHVFPTDALMSEMHFLDRTTLE